MPTPVGFPNFSAYQTDLVWNFTRNFAETSAELSGIVNFHYLFVILSPDFK